LPIMLKKPGSLDDPDLDLCFRYGIIGGAGAFMVPARERSQCRPAIKAKIPLEVSAEEAKEAPSTSRGTRVLNTLAQDAPRRAGYPCGRTVPRDHRRC
jgi:hypothetical protein